MHEYVQLLQWIQDQCDADGIYVPSPHEHSNMEKETYNTVNDALRFTPTGRLIR